MTSDLWTFSLAFYDDAPTQAACLELQDRLGGDVNVMLFALHRARLGHTLDDAAIAAADAAVAPWRREVVEPLRVLRRRLKGAQLADSAERQEAFRNQVKKVELGAEKIVQQMLDALPMPGPARSAPEQAARENLRRLAEFLEADLDDPVFARLQDRFAGIIAART